MTDSVDPFANELSERGTVGRVSEPVSRKAVDNHAPRSESIIRTVEDVPQALGRIVKGRCGAYAPRGTRCKLCGKVHPL